MALSSNLRARPVALADLEIVIEECISKMGVHLVDLVLRGEGNGKLVEVYIDSEQGITTEICSDVSREVGRVLDSSAVVRGPCRLTVSSPGIARPLKHQWQFKKHVGRDLDVNVRSQEVSRTVCGRLESMSNEAIVLRVGKKEEEIAFKEIVEARVRAPW